MKTLLMMLRCRVCVIVLLVSVCGLIGACEKPGGGDSSPKPPVATVFTAPEVDESGLPPGLRNRLAGLRETIKQSPTSADEPGAMGAIYYIHEFPTAAAVCFERAKELAPQTMHWWYYTGLTYEKLNQNDKAVEAYQKALELDASYGALYVRLAGLSLATDRERAEQLCERALELNPTNQTALYTLGLCQEAAGDQDGARKKFEEAVELAPNYREAHEALARVLESAGETAEAEQHKAAAALGVTSLSNDHLFSMLLRNGFDLDSLLGDCILLADRGLLEEANKALGRAMEVDAEGIESKRVMARIRVREEKLDEAVTAYREVLEARPEWSDVRAELADLMARQEKFTEAEAGFRKVLEVEPDHAFALERYARLLIVLDRRDEAEKLLIEAVERQPEAVWLRFTLGQMYMNGGKPEDAGVELRKCLELAPQHINARYSLGLIEKQVGNTEEAVKQWQKIVELRPDFINAHVGLADIAIVAHDFATAEDYLREGMKHQPDFAGFSNGLAWILATSPDEGQRNGEEALRLAEKACKLSDNQRHTYVDTLGAAYAELGRFEEAITTVKKAIELAQLVGAEDVIEAYQQRIKLYEQNQPYRDAP